MIPAADLPYFTSEPIGLAHRGGTSYAPNTGLENTVAAFTAAVALGFRYLETDVHATSDGVLVACHDPVLDRVTDAAGQITKLPWSDVSQARVDGREPVPRLDELFETFPDTCFNIDVKGFGAVEPLIETIRAHDAVDRVCIGSFSDRRTRRVRQALGPRLATSAGPLEVMRSMLLPDRVSRRWPMSPALQIPLTHKVSGRSIEVFTPRLLELAHARGQHVHVWTVDEPEEMHRLLDLGVDGLISDRIDLLAEVLAERGHPLRPR